jgi:hypothetical protein
MIFNPALKANPYPRLAWTGESGQVAGVRDHACSVERRSPQVTTQADFWKPTGGVGAGGEDSASESAAACRSQA